MEIFVVYLTDQTATNIPYNLFSSISLQREDKIFFAYKKIVEVFSILPSQYDFWAETLRNLITDF